MHSMKEPLEQRWPVQVYGLTHDEAGRPHRINRTVNTFGNVKEAIERVVSKHPCKRLWAGCDVEFITPLGQKGSFIINPDTFQAEKEDRT